MTSNFGKEFHKDYTGMLGMTGRTLIQRNMETFDVTNLLDLFLKFQKTYNKIKQNEEKAFAMRGLNDPEFHNRIFYSRWKPAKNYGYNLHDYPSDANNYAKKSLLPLDAKPY